MVMPVVGQKTGIGLVGIGSIIGVGVLAVAFGGVSGGVALPVVLDALKWVVGSYLAAQAGHDIAKTMNPTTTPTEPPK